MAFPSLYNLFSVWTSHHERATLMSLAYAGIPAASVLTFPLSSWLCEVMSEMRTMPMMMMV